jgi:thiol-disulfide isomerase/thioredoxin
MKRRTAVIGVAVAAAGAGIAWSLRRPDGARAAEEAMWGMTFERPDGATLNLATLRGQPLLLNFWATWCPPCVKEMPLLDSFHKQTQRQGWQLVGLAVDAPAPVQDFLRRTPVGFPIGVAGMAGIQLSRSLGNHNGLMPFTVVFARDGRVHARKLGAIEPADLERWRDRLSPAG